MALGPNQIGQTLQSPVSNILGYGNALAEQVDDEEEKRRKKAQEEDGGGVVPRLSRMIGY